MFYKIIRNLIVILIAVLLPITSYGMASTIPLITSDTYVGYEEYQNPQRIVIKTPEDKLVTSRPNISILGGCDPSYPITINGKTVRITNSGFFSEYASLTQGKNVFEIINGPHKKTLTITKVMGIASTFSNPKAVTISNTIGTVISDNISHFATSDTTKQIIEPLVKGTTFNIIGKQGNLYKIADGSFIFASTVQTSKGTLPENTVSKIYNQEIADKNITEFYLKMPINALYKVFWLNDRFQLTIENTKSNITPELQPNPMIKSVIKQSDANSKNLIYDFYFQNEKKPSGYYIEFKDGAMVLGIKQNPVLPDKNTLAGATVLLDPGHGGTDTGALGPAGVEGPTEAQINFQITMHAKNYLESKGATVLLTKQFEETLSLPNRVAKVKLIKPDLSLAIHCNSMGNTIDFNRASGYLTFYSFPYDKTYADFIGKSVTTKISGKDTGSRAQNLAMTRITNCPAALVENFFLSNPDDYEYVIKRQNQQTIGKAIGESIETYLKSKAQ